MRGRNDGMIKRRKKGGRKVYEREENRMNERK